MKKDNKRNGFTLVELLVVIAILAVLASVSVIGYLSFVKKSKVSNDSSLITQMNTTLQANEAIDGKNATAHDAIEELYESGLDVNKLSPTTEGYHYAIDMSQNRAFLLDGDYNKVAPENLSISSNKEDVFVMVGSYDQISTVNTEGYSVYLKNGFDWGAQALKEITTDKGIDVGDNEVTTIKYENNSQEKEEVIIRTNSFDTKIMVETTGTVNHYAKAASIDIKKVDTHSFHEYGQIAGEIKIKEGNFVAKENSYANNVFIVGKEATVTIDENSNVGKVVASDDSYYTNVTNNSKTTTVETSTMNEVENNLFSGGDGTKNFPFLISNNNNLKDLTKYTISIEGDIYFQLTNDIEMDLVVSENDKTYYHLVGQVFIYSGNLYLDMNDKTIRANDEMINADNPFGKATPSMFILNGGNLTIYGNGTIDCECGQSQVYGININGTDSQLTIKNGNFYGAITAIQVQQGSLLIESGNFNLAETCSSAVPEYSKYVVNAIDEYFKDYTAKIKIIGGTYRNFDPSNDPEGTGTTYVADGYKVIKETKEGYNNYTVIKNSD